MVLFSDVVAASQTYNQSASAIQIVVITEKTYCFFHLCSSVCYFLSISVVRRL